VPIDVIHKLQHRFEFYAMRAQLPTNRLLRIVPIYKFVIAGAYKNLEGGKWWRPILGDLFE
jgi:hypothetical protein